MFPDGDLYMDVTLLPQLVETLLEEEVRQIYEINLELQEGEIDIEEFQKLIFLFNLHKDDDLNALTQYKKDKLWREKEIAKGRRDLDESVATIESVSDDGNNPLMGKFVKLTPAEKFKKSFKKKLRRQLNVFISGLDIPCYFINPKNCKKQTLHYYYYDILEGLARNLFLNLLLESRKELFEREAAKKALNSDELKSNRSNDSSLSNETLGT